MILFLHLKIFLLFSNVFFLFINWSSFECGFPLITFNRHWNDDTRAVAEDTDRMTLIPAAASIETDIRLHVRDDEPPPHRTL